MSKTNLFYAGVLIAVIALAFFLRVVQAGKVPPAVSPEEAAIGWNAYSILKTGSNELHRFLPVDFVQASGEPLPTLLVYLTVPVVWVFGLNDFAVRLPSALFGSFSVLALYFVVLQLSRITAQTDGFPAGASLRPRDSATALLAALLLAISPQHIQLSRIALGQNLALFLGLWGIGMTLSARQSPRRYLIAGLPLACAFYAENSVGWLFIGLAGLALFLSLPVPRRQWRLLALSGFLTCVVLTSVISDYGNFWNQSHALRLVAMPDPRIDVGHYAQEPFLARVFEYFQPHFLLAHGGEDAQYSILDVGQLYLVDGLFLVLGLYALLRERRRLALFGGLWVLATAVLAGLLPGPASAVRFEAALPGMLIFSAAGIVYLVTALQGWKKTASITALVLIYSYSLGYFANNYFVHYPLEYSQAWQYGARQAIQAAEARQSDYDIIQVSDANGDAYHLVLYFTQFSPAEFWSTVQLIPEEGFFATVGAFGKFQFVSQFTPVVGKRVLYLLPADQAPKDAHILQTFQSLDGNPAFILID